MSREGHSPVSRQSATAASSGCIRLFNQDAIDLHRRTPVGSQVVVLAHG
jgi:lipoprotein-anchoring transpeptidase ErfK/SrfK